jgi:hypothetical protein
MDTWTDNLGALIRFQSLGFKWVSSPNFWSFFYWADISKIHHNFVIVKIGHFIGFGIFDLLLFHWKSSHKEALGISFTFALLTEILQLFFGRDGRLYDLIIDSLGAISVYFLVKYKLLDKPKKMLFFNDKEKKITKS